MVIYNCVRQMVPHKSPYLIVQGNFRSVPGNISILLTGRHVWLLTGPLCIMPLPGIKPFPISDQCLLIKFHMGQWATRAPGPSPSTKLEEFLHSVKAIFIYC